VGSDEALYSPSWRALIGEDGGSASPAMMPDETEDSMSEQPLKEPWGQTLRGKAGDRLEKIFGNDPDTLTRISEALDMSPRDSTEDKFFERALAELNKPG
jgi:hypothetical protein